MLDFRWKEYLALVAKEHKLKLSETEGTHLFESSSTPKKHAPDAALWLTEYDRVRTEFQCNAS